MMLAYVKDQKVLVRGFFALAFAILFLFTLYQLWNLVESRSPLARAEAMLSDIGGLAIHRPLPRELAEYPVEGVPGGKGPTLLGELRGKTVFLNFWATWCEPCIREIPSMLALAKQMRQSEFVMFAVSYDDSWKPVLSFFERYTNGIPPELLLGRDGQGQSDKSMRLRFGTEKLPETYIIRDGQILHKFISNHDWSDPKKLKYFRLVSQVGAD